MNKRVSNKKINAKKKNPPSSQNNNDKDVYSTLNRLYN